MVIVKQFVQHESKLPVYKVKENQEASQQIVEFRPHEDGSSEDDNNFDDESDAGSSDGGRANNKKAAKDGQEGGGDNKVNKLQVELYRTSVINCHSKKVKKVCIHQLRQLIYSIGEDKKLCVSSMETHNRLFQIKCSNMHPKTMELHQDNSRLYVAMKESIVFVFDVSEMTPIVQHTIKPVYVVNELSIDRSMNLVTALDQRGTLTCLQMSQRNPKLHEQTAQILGAYDQNLEGYRTRKFKWLSRHNMPNSTLNGTILEGSLKGKIWVRDIFRSGGRFLKVPTDFTDKIKDIQYDSEKNVVFVACRDGRIKCWKMPLHWHLDAL